MISLKKNQWTNRQANGLDVKECMNLLGISQVAADILCHRQIKSSEDLISYWNPKLEDLHDPFLMKDMDKAAKRLTKAMRQKEKIVIWGDYDADGATSVSLLLRFFRELNANVSYYIPNRLKDGYGLNNKGLKMLKEQEHAQVIVTVDNGIAAIEQARYAKEINVDLIITDHHEQDKILPDAMAVVNPKRQDCNYPDKKLAGVGVAFKLSYAIAKTMAGSKPLHPQLKLWLLHSLSLVALGTVADLVPLQGENRILAGYGLNQLSQCEWPGIKALKDISGIHDQVVASDVAFKLAPRINAAGRLDSADIGVRLMTTENVSEAFDMATNLDNSNVQRRKIEKEQAKEALKIVEDVYIGEERILVVAGENWHPGVIGIVASRLVEKYYLPVVVITFNNNGEGKGSCRSVFPFHIQEALSKVQDDLLNFGGHAMAAGFSIREDKIASFKKRISLIANQTFPELPQPTLKIDTWINGLNQLSNSLLNELNQMAPFGMDNPRPLLAVKNVNVTDIRRMGRDGNHLSFNSVGPQSCFRSIAFNSADLYQPMSKSSDWDLVFEPKINNWSGRPKIELDVKGLRPSGANS